MVFGVGIAELQGLGVMGYLAKNTIAALDGQPSYC